MRAIHFLAFSSDLPCNFYISCKKYLSLSEAVPIHEISLFAHGAQFHSTVKFLILRRSCKISFVTGSHCIASPRQLETCYVHKGGFELRTPPASAPWALGLKVCTTTPGLISCLLIQSFSLCPLYFPQDRNCVCFLSSIFHHAINKFINLQSNDLMTKYVRGTLWY